MDEAFEIDCSCHFTFVAKPALHLPQKSFHHLYDLYSSDKCHYVKDNFHCQVCYGNFVECVLGCGHDFLHLLCAMMSKMSSVLYSHSAQSDSRSMRKLKNRFESFKSLDSICGGISLQGQTGFREVLFLLCIGI